MKANEEKKANAFKDWLAGMTHKELAKKYHVSVKTIESWAKKNNWTELKASAIERAKNSIAVKFESKIIEGCEIFLDISLMIAQFCKQKLQEAILQENPQISCILKDALIGVQIYKSVMPEAPENISNQIAKDLQEIKRCF